MPEFTEDEVWGMTDEELVHHGFKFVNDNLLGKTKLGYGQAFNDAIERLTRANDAAYMEWVAEQQRRYNEEHWQRLRRDEERNRQMAAQMQHMYGSSGGGINWVTYGDVVTNASVTNGGANGEYVLTYDAPYGMRYTMPASAQQAAQAQQYYSAHIPSGTSW